MKSDKQLWNICFDIYRELFKLATPSRDFDDALNSGEAAKPGWFMAYYLSEEKQAIVIEKHTKSNKLSDYEINKIRTAVHLGCSPSIDKRATKNVRGGVKNE